MLPSSPETPTPSTHWLDRRPIRIFPALTVETLLFILILLLTVFTRFYDLGTRVMSHDESLHTYYSWLLSRGQGYQHNPMMHGPLQFHLIALSYFLFGSSDFTARIPVVLFSIASVAALWYWRRYLGRSGALLAAAMMLFSPYMLFYGRYVRNESYVVLFGLLMLLAVLRYLESGQARYIYLLAASVSLHFTSKETAFIYAAQLLIFLGAYFVVNVTRRPWEEKRGDYLGFLVSLLAAALGLGGALGVAFVNTKLKGPVNGDLTGAGQQLIAPQNVAPLESVLAIIGFLGLVGAGLFLARGFGRERLRGERAFDMLLLLGTLIAPMLIPFPMVIARQNPLDYSPNGLLTTSLFLVPIVLTALALGFWWNWSVWWRSAALFYAIFIVFYTTIFTNGQGFFTGLVGSLGYWLEQQGVERGSQPWYFYLLIQVPVYEFLPFLATLLGLGMGASRLWKISRAFAAAEEPASSLEAAPERENFTAGTSTLFINTFSLLVWWSFSSLVAYTLAGEKMPWLTVHIALPLILLGGWALGQVLDGVDWTSLRERGLLKMLALSGIFLASLSGIIVALNSPTLPFSGRELLQLQATATFSLALAGLLGSSAGIWWLSQDGWPVKQSLRLLGLAFFGLLLGLTLRASFRANYVNYDSGMEYLVYAHGYTGNKDVLSQVKQISEFLNGDPYSINVAYDDDTSWPMSWYMREFPNAVFYGASPSRELRNSPAIIVGDNNFSKIEPIVSKEYLRYDFIRMVWPNQDYFNLDAERFWHAVNDPQLRAAIFDIWLNRDYRLYAQATGRGTMGNQNWDPSDRMRLYVRKDVAAKIWSYGAPAVPTAADPYADKAQTLQADLVFGSQGSQPGEFDAPRGMAFAPDGSLYVADSRNHRIQHFDAQGNFLGEWGSFGDLLNTNNAPLGTFNEPWGVAVDADGFVYVSDTWNHRIQKFSAEGNPLKTWGQFGLAADNPEFLYGPRGLSFDSQGHLFVSDTGNKRIVIYDTEGRLLGFFGSEGYEPGQFSEPVDVKVGADGNLYVTDTWNQRIQVFSPISADGLQFAPLLQWDIYGWESDSLDNKPFVAQGQNGNLFVTDPENYRVLEFTSAGQIVRLWGDFGTEDFAFGLPSGIVTDSQGHVWVSDAGNHRIMRFTP